VEPLRLRCDRNPWGAVPVVLPQLLLQVVLRQLVLQVVLLPQLVLQVVLQLQLYRRARPL
jgi:hypothetical protein